MEARSYPGPEDVWPEHMEGPQDETDLDPDPLPQNWRDEAHEHRQETGQWLNNPAPLGPSHCIQRVMAMHAVVVTT